MKILTNFDITPLLAYLKDNEMRMSDEDIDQLLRLLLVTFGKIQDGQLNRLIDRKYNFDDFETLQSIKHTELNDIYLDIYEHLHWWVSRLTLVITVIVSQYPDIRELEIDTIRLNGSISSILFNIVVPHYANLSSSY